MRMHVTRTTESVQSICSVQHQKGWDAGNILPCLMLCLTPLLEEASVLGHMSHHATCNKQFLMFCIYIPKLGIYHLLSLSLAAVIMGR